MECDQKLTRLLTPQSKSVSLVQIRCCSFKCDLFIFVVPLFTSYVSSQVHMSYNSCANPKGGRGSGPPPPWKITSICLVFMCMSYMLPIVDYASVVWDGCSEQDSVTLQKVQNKAAPLVTGLTRAVSLENLYNECGWATLSQRRQQHTLSFMYNVNTGIVPSYIQDLIPPLVSEVSDYPFRNTRNITVPYNRTSISQKSCIPSSIKLWNSHADDLKDSSSLSTFKKSIIANLNLSCVPYYFTMEIRYSSVIHTRLRNNCTSLNNDLFRNHVRDNPLCEWCGVMEDAIHFSFHCIKYIDERQVFNDTVRYFQTLTMNLILFGSEN